jgi:hypothetical protein
MVGIKGMKIPTKCSECHMYKQSGIDVYCGADYVGIDSAFKKRDNCPLTEIVTCKDCKYWDEPYCNLINNFTDGDYYCASAKRRKQNG